MNQREMEKQIWDSLLTMARNLYDFDQREYERLRHGHDRYSDFDAQPLTTEKHQERFDRALNRVTEIIERKAS